MIYCPGYHRWWRHTASRPRWRALVGVKAVAGTLALGTYTCAAWVALRGPQGIPLGNGADGFPVIRVGEPSALLMLVPAVIIVIFLHLLNRRPR
jgi:hypothetical protein